MAWFRRARTPVPEPEAPAEERAINLSQYAAMWSGMSGVYSPMPVGLERALTMSACWACIDVLASSISSTPVDVVQYRNGARFAVSPTPSLVAAPSAVIDQDVWLYQLVESMRSDGNAFGLVAAVDGMGRPTTIEIQAPESVTQRKVVDGVAQAVIGNEVHKVYPFGDLWHVPGTMTHAGSVFGANVIEKAAATVGAALAAREYGARTYSDGGVPVGRWKSSRDLTEPEAKQIKAVLRNVTAGSREPIVTGTGLEWESLAIDMDQSQFLDVMKFAIEEACRFFRVPPAMVYAATSGQSITYANVSQADLAFLKWSVNPIMVRIERRLSALLTRPQVVKFNRGAFLQMDAPTRWQIHDLRLKNKTTTVNEVRALEDDEPFVGAEFDEPGIPGAMAAPSPPVGGSDGTTD